MSLLPFGSAPYKLPLTTAGDLVYENAVPKPARLPIGTAGQVLTVTAGLPSWVTLTGGGVVTMPNVIQLTGAGTYTPSAGVLYLKVTAIGGGGGGSGGGVTGTGTGNPGTSTTFGTGLLVAGEGIGGSSPSASASIGAGGLGGTPTVAAGPLIITSVAGGEGAVGAGSGSPTRWSAGGSGGGSGGGAGGIINTHGDDGAANTGSGGGGGGISSVTGGLFPGSGGGAGATIVVYITSGILASYAYSVGVGGPGGTGTNANGGAGGSGYLVIEEYFNYVAGAGDQILAANTVAIPSGATSIAITYSTTIAASYSLNFSFFNTVDATPIFLQGMITAQSTTGFTVTFNTATDTANYQISYTASVVV